MNAAEQKARHTAVGLLAEDVASQFNIFDKTMNDKFGIVANVIEAHRKQAIEHHDKLAGTINGNYVSLSSELADVRREVTKNLYYRTRVMDLGFFGRIWWLLTGRANV